MGRTPPNQPPLVNRSRAGAALALALAALAAACRRGEPAWHEPLGARIAGSTFQAGVPLQLRTAAGPNAVVPRWASLPAATYRVDQAARGRQIYEATCARCHPPGQLDGPAFGSAWNNRRVYDLYSLVSNTMPQDRPGSLRDIQYADVIAYLLQRNRAPAGVTPLRPDTAALKTIRIAVAPAPVAP